MPPAGGPPGHRFTPADERTLPARLRTGPPLPPSRVLPAVVVTVAGAPLGAVLSPR